MASTSHLEIVGSPAAAAANATDEIDMSPASAGEQLQPLHLIRLQQSALPLHLQPGSSTEPPRPQVQTDLHDWGFHGKRQRQTSLLDHGFELLLPPEPSLHRSDSEVTLPLAGVCIAPPGTPKVQPLLSEYIWLSKRKETIERAEAFMFEALETYATVKEYVCTKASNGEQTRRGEGGAGFSPNAALRKSPRPGPTPGPPGPRPRAPGLPPPAPAAPGPGPPISGPGPGPQPRAPTPGPGPGPRAPGRGPRPRGPRPRARPNRPRFGA